MADDKIEFKIVKDVGQKELSLKSLSIEAANALSILLRSMLAIIEDGDKEKEISIKILDGSAVLLAEGPPTKIANIYNEFENVINHTSTNKRIIDEWKKVQDLFVKNGLEYEASFITGGQRMPIYTQLKNAAVKSRRRVAEINPTLHFFKGKLISVGGRQPNIHIDIPNEKVTIVQCSESSAKRANVFLYDTIRVSAWKEKSSNGDKIIYKYCDAYTEDEIFDDFKSFIFRYQQSHDQIASLKEIHYKCRSFLDRKKYRELRKFIRLFIHESIDVNALKTLLVITQSLKDRDELRESRAALKQLFDKLMNKFL